MEILDKDIILKGSVTKRLIDKATGKVVEEFEDHNLVVKVGRSEIVKLIIGQSSVVAGQTTKITSMAVGSGGTAVATPFVPIPPADGDTALATPISNGVNTINTTTMDLNQTKPQVTFVTLFDCSKVNSNVNEACLLFNDLHTMFARHTFKTVPLTSDTNMSLEITWIIQL